MFSVSFSGALDHDFVSSYTLHVATDHVKAAVLCSMHMRFLVMLARENLPFQYCTHVIDFSVQCDILTR